MKDTGERGEFFHPSLSPFGYNETVAQEYYPMGFASGALAPALSQSLRQQADSLGEGAPLVDYSQFGYHRSDYEPPAPQSEKVVEGAKLPEYGCKIIHEQKPQFLEDILRYAIRCEVSGKLFRLQKQEIDFYIKHNIPLPRKHPDVRHAERMALRR